MYAMCSAHLIVFIVWISGVALLAKQRRSVCHIAHRIRKSASETKFIRYDMTSTGSPRPSLNSSSAITS